VELGFELTNPRDGVERRGGGIRLAAAARKGVQAGTDPELRLEQATVLLGERISDRARRDEAELDEDRSERSA